MGDKTDHWMPLLIGSYLRDTQHLDAERHGCYLLWLMHYWIKGPLPNSVQELVLIGRLRGLDAPSIAHALLAEFFTLERDGMYHQKRADIEKVRWNGKQHTAKEKAEAAARARWKNHASSNPPSNAPSNAQAMLGRCPTPTPKSNIKASPLSPAANGATLRPEEFGNAWNQNAGKLLPRIREFTESRRKKVSLRMKQGLTLEKFTEAAKLCREKPFLRGEGGGWKARFDWLIQNDVNINRVFEEDWGVRNGGNTNGGSKQAKIDAAFDQVGPLLQGLDTSGAEGNREPDKGRDD